MCFRISLILFLIDIILAQNETRNETENEILCRERNRLISSLKRDLFDLVEVIEGQKLKLQCHYCNENDDDAPKIWYKSNLSGDTSFQEVRLNMDKSVNLNRIHVNPEHSLIVHNVSFNDSGVYFCQGFQKQESENKYNYFVDVIFDVNSTSEIGNLTAWRKYHDDNFVGVNRLFSSPTGTEYLHIRDQLQLTIELITNWQSWSPCDVCGRPQGDGRKKKNGFCRLKIFSSNNTEIYQNVTYEKFFMNLTEISCRSVFLAKLFPGISNTTRIIPNFVQIERCDGTCNPDAEGKNAGWKTGKSLGFKYRKTIVLAENAHLTLVCPESTLENVVTWRRNGKILPPGESVEPPEQDKEPRITVDTFNTLYLYEVTSEEEGNYTCQVDKIRMQQVTIYIASKSRLLTQAFVRHMMYLAFILSLTSSCYCAGLIVTWTRRRTFKSYEDVKEAENKKELKLEEGLINVN